MASGSEVCVPFEGGFLRADSVSRIDGHEGRLHFHLVAQGMLGGCQPDQGDDTIGHWTRRIGVDDHTAKAAVERLAQKLVEKELGGPADVSVCWKHLSGLRFNSFQGDGRGSASGFFASFCARTPP